MDPFGEGETGKISIDSSKKDGRGTGGRGVPDSGVCDIGPVVVAVVGAAGMVPLWTSWSVRWVSVGGVSLGTSLEATDGFISYGIIGSGRVSLRAFLFLFFRSSAAVVAGPLVAATLATVVDLVDTSLLVGVAYIGTDKRGEWLGVLAGLGEGASLGTLVRYLCFSWVWSYGMLVYLVAFWGERGCVTWLMWV